MGKKKTEETNVASTPPVPDIKDEDEDTAVVKALKAIDDKYCAIEIEYEAEVAKLRQKIFNEKQAPLLEERAKALQDATGAVDPESGTPACKGFWLQAFQNADVFAEILEEHDEPVLEYLQDVKRTYTDSENPLKGFKLEFFFRENPFFANSTLTMECVVDYDPATYKPWKEPQCLEVKSSTIDWKPGKNVTVEMVAKKTKGGGAKKAKQKAKAPKEEPRESLFRILFRNMKKGDPAPEDLKAMMGGGEDDDDEHDEEMVDMFLGQLHEVACSISEEIIPYAVRYYTGEAGDAESDDDEESEEEDGDDDDDESDSEDEPAPKKKGGKKPAAGGMPAGAKKEEECKQQ